MGLIEDAAETLETEVNNLKLNVQDAVEALDSEYAGSLYDTVLTTKLGKVVGWAQKNALWPATFGLACNSPPARLAVLGTSQRSAQQLV